MTGNDVSNWTPRPLPTTEPLAGPRVTLVPLDVTDHDAVVRVFDEFRDELGGLDRVVVNAGLGKGQPLGTGRFDANRQTAETNFIGALAQTEAAARIFREQDAGQLVMISSISAIRGMPKNITTYAATKAAIAHVAEGIRMDLVGRKGHDIKVSTIYPGYIASEMNEQVEQEQRLMVDTATGVRSMVKAIDKAPLNQIQTYTLTKEWTERGKAKRAVLAYDFPTSPANVGPRTTPDYPSLSSMAIFDIANGKKVFVGPKDDFGYNAQTDKYENLLSHGVIDPVKVVRTALQNAASVASLMLTTECLVAERPKDEKPSAGGHDHGGHGHGF